MKLLKEWTDYEEMEQKCMTAIYYWSEYNLDFYPNTDSFFSGFAYTSSGIYAGLFQCNCIAKYKWDNHFSFHGIAISEDNFIVAVFSEYDDDGNELIEKDDMQIIIGRL